MKKILSAVLATAMIASMGAVAFAANLEPNTTKAYRDDYADIILGKDDGAPTVKVDDNKVYFPVVGIKGPYGYNTDDKALFDNIDHGKATTVDGYTTAYNAYYAPVEYGNTAYYALVQYVPKTVAEHDYSGYTKNTHNGKEVNADVFEDGGYTLVTESETVSSLSIKQEWEEGKNLVKSVSIVKKKVSNLENTTNPEETNNEYSGGDSDDPKRYYPNAKELGLHELSYEKDKYYYFVAITFEDSSSVNDTDVIGTLTLKKSKDPKVDKLELEVDNNVDWEKSWRSDSNEYKITGDDVDLKADTNYALKFDCDEEVTFNFDDDSTFTVDVSGQSKILFNYSTDYISKIAAKYPMAELNFWNGNGAKFNRVGEMFLSCEDLTGHQFLYQVTSDGKLAEVPGAEWDDSDEGFYFNTRVLGSYVISDMELDVSSEKETTNNSGSTATVVTPAPITNPSTGAIA